MTPRTTGMTGILVDRGPAIVAEPYDARVQGTNSDSGLLPRQNGGHSRIRCAFSINLRYPKSTCARKAMTGKAITECDDVSFCCRLEAGRQDVS